MENQYLFCLYSLGVMPVFFLKKRQKYAQFVKPSASETSQIGTELSLSIFFAMFILSSILYCSGL